jgi:thymidylate synthase ThyX
MPTAENAPPSSHSTQPGQGFLDVSARRIYLMPELPPEVVAVSFAKTSRSPEPFDQIAAELTATASAKFHEKWVVGYGHASVAEHAVLSIAIENVSILAAKAIEDNRLASYTEKSTRYQVYDTGRVYRPAVFARMPELQQRYEQLITTLLQTYQSWHQRAFEWLRENNPRTNDESERAWESRLRAKACDGIRYLLPTATLTNLGWTVNARALAAAIRKLAGSDLAELQDIASELKTAAMREVPTLLKYSDPDRARSESAHAVSRALESVIQLPARDQTDHPPEVTLLHFDGDGLRRLCCAIAYSSWPLEWTGLEAQIDRWSTDDMLALVRSSLAGLGPYDPLPRAFECLNYLFEVTVDYGAWRDIQRHRIGTQIAQELSPELGYTVPQLVEDLGLRSEFESLISASASTYDALHVHFPEDAVYALMLAFHKRTLFNWNLREVFHFVRLRGTAKGHDAYRKVAVHLWREVVARQPWLGELVFPLGHAFPAAPDQ